VLEAYAKQVGGLGEKLISQSASIFGFEKAAAEMGMITMEQDGLTKALENSTTIEEVWRVTRG